MLSHFVTWENNWVAMKMTLFLRRKSLVGLTPRQKFWWIFHLNKVFRTSFWQPCNKFFFFWKSHIPTYILIDVNFILQQLYKCIDSVTSNKKMRKVLAQSEPKNQISWLKFFLFFVVVTAIFIFHPEKDDKSAENMVLTLQICRICFIGQRKKEIMSF